MDRLIFHNDRLVPLEQASLSPGQAGLLTGLGVFTTLRIYHGLPFAFDRHWARMQRDASRLGMELGYSEPSVREATIELARANQRPEATARIYLVRNTGGIWSELLGRPATDLLILTRDLVAWPQTMRLQLESGGVFSAGHLAGAKILAWAAQTILYQKAQAEGFHEALLLNEKDQLAECASANVFLVRGEKVLTPPLSSGCLPGVTREILLEIAPRAGFEMREQELTPNDLSAASEVFISSTTREVAPVESISPDWKFPAPGKVTLALEKAFSAHVESWLSEKLETRNQKAE